ncbi:MAG: hypothetical protein EXX96DRAFT_580615 [Benjaminiella poitrasii]|nr:MAG: hypothetical protein EXX96DRAFT_580615 [Benjaminiella poitrasii]
MKDITDRFLSWTRQEGKMLVRMISKWHCNKPTVILASASILAYLGLVRYLRFKAINDIRKKHPNPKDALTNIDTANEINAITAKKEFPFLSRESTEFALFKTFAIPTISKLLAATGEFATSCARRVEDTELILTEMTETYARIQNQLCRNPQTAQRDIDAQWERPKLATKRLNEIHGKYTISNDDYLYTLSLFIFEPIAWINQYEWRKLDERESNALFCIWYNVGVSMNLKDIPDTPEKMLAFKNRYAAEKIQYAPANWKCGEPTVRHLLSNLPAWLREPAYDIALRVLPSVLDPADVKAFRMPYSESRLITSIVRSAFKVRAFIIRHCMLPRTTLLSRTPFYANEQQKYVPHYFQYKPHIYKEGYRISELGPEKFQKDDTI